MYHQFMQLADIDITKEPMEVGPTTHYIMGGIRVDADSQMTSVPGLFAAGECGAGLHGANRLGGNSLSDLLVFGKRAGEYAAQFAKENGADKVNEAEIETVASEALKPFDNADGENPFQIQYDLQDMMQDLVGIARSDDGLNNARAEIRKLGERADQAGVGGNREYNPGWHTALDLHHMLTISESIALAALERRASTGAHSRDDYPEKEEPGAAKYNTVVRKNADGEMEVSRELIPELREDLQDVIEEMG